MLKKIYYLFLIFFTGIALNSGTSYAGIVDITGDVQPQDATLFNCTDVATGLGEVELTWTTSKTPNIDTQRIEIDGPQSPGVDYTTKDLIPFPGPSTPDNYNDYPPNTNVTDLVIGWPYIFRHVSIAGSLESSGVFATCTPSSPLPAPVLNAEPSTTTGTSNTLSWTNGGIDGVGLECQISASTHDLNEAQYVLGPYEAQSSWIPCDSSAQTYEHTFTGLSTGTTYFYHVQSRAAGMGESPFSNVVFSTQVSETGPPPEEEPPPSGGGTRRPSAPSEPPEEEEPPEEPPVEVLPEEPLPVCGNGELEEGEECDDGNNIDGDGCSAACELETKEITFEIKGEPEFRAIIDETPNLALSSQFLVYKPSIQSLDMVQVRLDDYGEATYTGEIVLGTYDFGLNGDAHNTKIIENIEINEDTEVVELDFTTLTAGDTKDDNVINALDLAKMVEDYKQRNINSDLNKDRLKTVNALDLSILITNYKKRGMVF
jgi:cysteine-rich repeat protein